MRVPPCSLRVPRDGFCRQNPIFVIYIIGTTVKHKMGDFPHIDGKPRAGDGDPTSSRGEVPAAYSLRGRRPRILPRGNVGRAFLARPTTRPASVPGDMIQDRPDAKHRLCSGTGPRPSPGPATGLATVFPSGRRNRLPPCPPAIRTVPRDHFARERGIFDGKDNKMQGRRFVWRRVQRA